MAGPMPVKLAGGNECEYGLPPGYVLKAITS